MAKGDAIGGTEEVVRAAMYPYWDEAQKRATPSAFTQAEVSVSRLAIWDLAEILSTLEKTFNHRVHPDGVSLTIRGVGRAKVADILRQSEEPIDATKPDFPPVFLTVVEDPIKDEPRQVDNPSHALICGWHRNNRLQSRRISKGVANRLLKIFSWETVSG